VAAKSSNGRQLESRVQAAGGLERPDLGEAVPADGADLIGIEGVERVLNLATEDAVVLAATAPVAELDEIGDAVTELFHELTSQARHRVLDLESAAG
jgi:hypothetical protein